jgi:hypothetical protein
VQSVPITTKHYAMEFVSALSMVFSGTPVSSTNKTDRHNITDTVESGVKHITLTLK